MTSNSSDAYAMDHNLKNAGKYVHVLHEDTFIHGPLNFATGQNHKTRDRIGQEDWQALADHRHMFLNSVPGHDAPTYSIQVDNEVHMICPGIHQDMFNHMFALQSDDDESLFGDVEDTDTGSPEIDNGEEHTSRINGKEAEIKNNISTHTLGGSVEGEGKPGVEQRQNQDNAVPAAQLTEGGEDDEEKSGRGAMSKRPASDDATYEAHHGDGDGTLGVDCNEKRNGRK